MRSPQRTAGTPPSPPPPRKAPRQKRSQATVDYILDAARRILHDDGAAALTTRRVAEQSGVAIGSLYQYFQNRDAILARLAEEEARRESQALQYHYARMRHLPLDEYLGQVVAGIVGSERRMLAFGGEFYRRYARHYRVAQRAGRRQCGDILDADTLTRDARRLFAFVVPAAATGRASTMAAAIRVRMVSSCPAPSRSGRSATSVPSIAGIPRASR